MPQYDGAIRIATKITTKDAKESLASLEWQIKKSAKYMDELRAKMDTLKDQKAPTQEYKKLETELSKAQKKFSFLLDQQKEFEKLGRTGTYEWNALNNQIADARINIENISEKMQTLVDTGKAFTIDHGVENQYKALELQLQYEEESVRKASEHYNKLLKSKDAYKNLADAAKKFFNSIGNVLKKVNSLVDSFGKHIKNTFLNFKKSSDSANKSALGLSASLKNILKYGFGIRSLYVLVNKLRSAITDGFGNLLEYSEPLKNSIDNLKASALTLKNAFAAAFSPFVEIAIPYVQKLLDYMIQLANMAGQFFAALAGQKNYTKAIRQTADAFKDAKKTAEGYLSPLDEINKYKDGKDKGALDGATMFEEAPVDNKFIDLADRMKDIFSDLFKPLKEAWNRDGKFVIDSWKYALGEVRKLINDIGRDFIAVWQQESTVKTFEDLLRIIGDIGLVSGNLSRNFREAWDENKVGLGILQNIRDVIGIIVQHIRNAADATVVWSDNLDFYPLLDAFNRFTESLKPAVDALSGILEDFYTQVLLPLGKWTLEEGLPELLDVFTDFNNDIDWETLRTNLSEFWDHLEPFAETVGEGLIAFIDRLSDALAEFLNSQEFKDFLTSVEDWMDNNSPDDVANGLEKITKGIIALKVGLAAWGALKAPLGVLASFISLLSAAKTATALKNLAGGAGAASTGTSLFSGISAAFSSLGGIGGILTTDLATIIGAGTAAEIGVTIGTAIIAGVTMAIIGFNFGKLLGENLFPEDADYYKNFKWLGEGGFFDTITKDWETTFEALERMVVDLKNNKFVQFLTGDIHGLMGNKYKTWDETKEEVLGAITQIKEEAPKIWAGFMDGIDTISDWFENSVKPWFTKEKWTELFQNVISSASEKWKDIKDWWKSDVSPWVSDAWESIKDAIKAPINGIIGMVETLANSVIKGINAVIGAFNGLNFDIPDWVPGIGGESVGFNIPELKNVSIPRLATGTVIPPNKEFLAVLGDQKHGTNIEAPLDTIKQATEESVLNVLSKLGMSGGNMSGTPVNLTLQISLDGAVLGKKMVDWGKLQQMATGNNPYELGTT